MSDSLLHFLVQLCGSGRGGQEGREGCFSKPRKKEELSAGVEARNGIAVCKGRAAVQTCLSWEGCEEFCSAAPSEGGLPSSFSAVRNSGVGVGMCGFG